MDKTSLQSYTQIAVSAYGACNAEARTDDTNFVYMDSSRGRNNSQGGLVEYQYLHQDAGRALQSRAPIRQEQDYSHLISYQKKLNADIIAFQEMGSPRAGARIFQPEEYTIIFPSRYNQPIGNGRMKGDIFTALATRRSIRIIQHEEVVDLQRVVPIRGKNSWTRRGVAALIEVDDKRFWVLSIHLKSSCHGRILENPANIHCETLAEQRKVLEIWIDERFNDGIPFMILGDFNRYIDIHGQNDHLWSHIDDKEPIRRSRFTQTVDTLRLFGKNWNL